jgi:hypothetical protein
MSEDKLHALKKRREEREIDYSELKGMLEGIRLAKLSPIEESMLRILELVMKGFKNTVDYLDNLAEGQIRLTQRIENLEKEAKQLRTTLDTLEENR